MSNAAMLVAHAAVTWALCGLIWTVQVLVYPSFARVPREGFARYHAHHTAAITWVVAPLMGLELLLAFALAVAPPASVSPASAWAGFGLVALAWLSTAFVQVPLHARLGREATRDAVRRLVATNWLRTVAWTLRAVLAGWWLVTALG